MYKVTAYIIAALSSVRLMAAEPTKIKYKENKEQQIISLQDKANNIFSQYRELREQEDCIGAETNPLRQMQDIEPTDESTDTSKLKLILDEEGCIIGVESIDKKLISIPGTKHATSTADTNYSTRPTAYTTSTSQSFAETSTEAADNCFDAGSYTTSADQCFAETSTEGLDGSSDAGLYSTTNTTSVDQIFAETSTEGLDSSFDAGLFGDVEIQHDFGMVDSREGTVEETGDK